MLASDDDSQGELAPVACKILMKLLWLARLSRPDIIKPIGDLARDVQKWSINNDKALYRLVCYVHSTLDYRLTGQVNDPLDQLKLKLFVDADSPVIAWGLPLSVRSKYIFPASMD